MISNVVLKSSDRNLFGVTIKQRTENSFLSVSDLQEAYEKARWQHGWNDRSIIHLLQTDTSKERLYHLLNERDVIKCNFLQFMEMIEKEGVVKTLKGLGVWKTTGRGADKTVYADPYIWVMIALELNPLLYAKVIMWLTDTLIFDRIEAGTEFKPMNSAISRIVEKPNYSKYAIELNKKVFGHHQSGMRNLASSRELNKIAKIEQFVTNAIDMGFLKNEEDVLKAIQTHR